MRTPHDPRPADRLVEHYATALAVARRKYPGLSPADHEDIVQEAIANVLDRLRRGALDDVPSYLLRVVFTAGAHVLQDRHRATLSLDVRDGDPDGVERLVDRSVTPLSPEERLLERDACAHVRRVLLEQLDADERRALTLRMVHERLPVEIAAELGITVRRYRNLRERALRKLAAGVARAEARRRTVRHRHRSRRGRVVQARRVSHTPR